MKLKYITIIPAIIIMAVIFSFSSKPGDNSNGSSLKIAGRLLSVYENVANTHLTGETRAKALDSINLIVRKGSHFSIYLLLACAFAFHLLKLKRKGKQLLFLPIVLSAAYASTDEFHQLFVTGRSGLFTDVLIDTTGAAMGSLLFTAIVILCARGRKRGQKTVTISE